MKFITCIILIWATGLSANAQFSEDFETSPSLRARWTGDVDSFTVNAEGWLQLNARSAGISTIFTELVFPDSISWMFDLNMPFPPSRSNRSLIILLASSNDPAEMNGYALVTGESGSPDPVCMYAVEKGDMQLLNCSDGLFFDLVSHSFVVTYDMDGDWTISTGNSPESTAEVLSLNEVIHPPDYKYFGLQCQYTTSRAQHFLFDNIKVDRKRPDTIPPALVSFDIVDKTRLMLLFSEALNQTSSERIQLTPLSAIDDMITIEDNRIAIMPGSPMNSGQLYELLISGVSDVVGNTMPDSTLIFTFWESRSPKPGELIITEVLPDPRPGIGLPEQEYLELYNTTASALGTGGLRLVADGGTAALPDTIIPPFAFGLVSETFDEWPSTAGEVRLPISTLPALKNSEGTWDLVSEDQLIHSIRYTDDIYAAEQVPPDGRSIEMVDSDQPCMLNGNWIPSLHLSGGTPGKPNSTRASLSYLYTGPSQYYISTDRDYLEVYFNSILSSSPTLNITFDPPVAVKTVETRREIVHISFETNLIADTDYFIDITGARDCTGQTLPPAEINIITPSEHTSKQIVINEILFDPEQGCPAFIEILNYSGHAVNADNLAITGSFGTLSVTVRRTLPPNGIMAITRRPLTLSKYFGEASLRLCARQNIPAPDRNSDLLLLHSRDGRILDSARYHEEWHHPALSNTKGVSLERISPLLNGNHSGSWQSASNLAGSGTPGMPNSQSAIPGKTKEEMYFIENDVFSPDGDGFQDELIIHFNNREAHVVKATVTNVAGQVIRSIGGYAITGSNAVLSWDGSDQSGDILPAGLYLLLLEFVGNNGRSEFFKHPVVVAGRL